MKIPSGESSVYILRDVRLKEWFKVGFTGRDGATRSSEERRRINSEIRGSLADTPMYLEWIFKSGYSAFYIEQHLIAAIENCGFKPVDRNNWYEIGKEKLDSLVDAAKPLVKVVRDYENFVS